MSRRTEKAVKNTSRSTSWKETIAVIGCGNMGGALIGGFCSKLKVDPKRIVACDTDAEKLADLQKRFGVRTSGNPKDAVSGAHVILLALKPKLVGPVLKSLKPVLAARRPTPLLVSIAAGVMLEEIRGIVGPRLRIVRGMPNLPCSIGVGLTAIYGSDPDDVLLAEYLFQGVGETIILQQESEMDAATALGASAPAFIFHVVEALADGGVKVGLTREQAMSMAAQMTRGAVAMILQSGRHPAELKDMVASPGGTTIAGLHVLEKAAVRGAMISAVEAAAVKAAERRKGR
jgi:pyrroline-5-carboxylate reductase